MTYQKSILLGFWISLLLFTISASNIFGQELKSSFKRERIKLNEGWHFMRYKTSPDNLIYDVRPKKEEVNDSKVADSKPTEAVKVEENRAVLKNWILPSANDFIKDTYVQTAIRVPIFHLYKQISKTMLGKK